MEQKNEPESESEESDSEQPKTFEEKYERMVKKQIGGYIADYSKLCRISPHKEDPFTQ